MKLITNLSEKVGKERLFEIVRFCIVGVIAVLIQYGVYLTCCVVIEPECANAVGYLVSFVYNYFASTRYTFKVGFTLKRCVLFILCHIMNFSVQSGLLHLFISFEIDKCIALIPVFIVSVPLNFLFVRLALKGMSVKKVKYLNKKNEIRV